MKKVSLAIIIGIIYGSGALAQGKLVEVTSKTFKTGKRQKIDGQTGYLEVPENRENPSSRIIKVKYVWLKSLAANPQAPVVFLEGGSGLSTWQAESPGDLADWAGVLGVSDLIFLDRRGSSDESLTYIWEGEFPQDFFVTEEAANAHYAQMAEASLNAFKNRSVDVTGYTIEAHARDVDELMSALGIARYSIFGFSFGSHIGMTVMKLFPDRLERAVFSGADAINQSFNYPRYLEAHIDKLAAMIEADPSVNQVVPDFRQLVVRVMTKLAKNPAIVSVKNPVTGKKMDLKIGAFGFGLLLRLDIDDYNDIPVLPRLLHNIDRGDYTMLAWFAQKRLPFSLAIPGGGINQQLASGASPARWSQIELEAEASMFGNVVNFPFSSAKDHWVPNHLSFDPSAPLTTAIPTLFITGDLDCRTPIEQVEETMNGFENAVHVTVENAGHEQAHWDAEAADEIIPSFLKGEKINQTSIHYGDIEFIKVIGKATGHASLR